MGSSKFTLIEKVSDFGIIGQGSQFGLVKTSEAWLMKLCWVVIRSLIEIRFGLSIALRKFGSRNGIAIFCLSRTDLVVKFTHK